MIILMVDPMRVPVINRFFRFWFISWLGWLLFFVLKYDRSAMVGFRNLLRYWLFFDTVIRELELSDEFVGSHGFDRIGAKLLSWKYICEKHQWLKADRVQFDICNLNLYVHISDICDIIGDKIVLFFINFLSIVSIHSKYIKFGSSML